MNKREVLFITVYYKHKIFILLCNRLFQSDVLIEARVLMQVRACLRVRVETNLRGAATCKDFCYVTYNTEGAREARFESADCCTAPQRK